MQKQLAVITQTTIVALAAILLSRSAAAAPAPSKLSAGDRKFVESAYQGGLDEIASAHLAQDKARDAMTRKVAKRMIADHTKANDRLKEIAQEENLDLSKMQAKSATVAGDNFDRSYLTALKQAHEKDIAMFEREASDAKAGEDHDVPSFARKTLPTLREHLKMVNAALASMK